jgi:hypothetical protein
MYKLKDKSTFDDLSPREICSTYEKYITSLISKEVRYPFSALEYVNNNKISSKNCFLKTYMIYKIRIVHILN